MVVGAGDGGGGEDGGDGVDDGYGRGDYGDGWGGVLVVVVIMVVEHW